MHLKTSLFFCFSKCTCLFVCVQCVWRCPWRPEEAVTSLGIQVTGSCELPSLHIGNWPGPMARAASVLNSLSTTPSLQALQKCSSLNEIYLLCMSLYLFSLPLSLFTPFPSCSEEYMWLKLEVMGSLWVLYPTQKAGSSLSLWHDIEGYLLSQPFSVQFWLNSFAASDLQDVLMHVCLPCRTACCWEDGRTQMFPWKGT